MEGYVQGAVRKELLMVTGSFRRALQNNYFWKVSLITFINTSNKMPKSCSFAEFLLIED